VDGIRKKILSFPLQTKKEKHSKALIQSCNMFASVLEMIAVRDYITVACTSSASILFSTKGYKIGLSDIYFVNNSTFNPSKLNVMNNCQLYGLTFAE